jgi:glycosyltransferase involved in cell wall biosynthesis
VGTENEILTDRSNALLNNNDSPRELAQKLMEIRADAELRSMLGRMAQSDAVELFDSQKFLDQYAEVYSGLSVVSPRS